MAKKKLDVIILPAGMMANLTEEYRMPSMKELKKISPRDMLKRIGQRQAELHIEIKVNGGWELGIELLNAVAELVKQKNKKA